MKDARGVSILEEEGVGFALHLKSDWTAEHEFGIDDLHDLLGANVPGTLGISRYQMSDSRTHEVATTVELFESRRAWNEYEPGNKEPIRRQGKVLCLRLHPLWHGRGKTVGHPSDFHGTGLSGMFDGSGFEIIAYRPHTKAFIRSLHQAILTADFAAHMGENEGNPFGRGGLNLSIVSMVPASQQALLEEFHAGQRALDEAVKGTGIPELLRSMKMDVRYLQAEWTDVGRHRRAGSEKPTDHAVVFRLGGHSPLGTGWLTVEDIRSSVQDLNDQFTSAYRS